MDTYLALIQTATVAVAIAGIRAALRIARKDRQNAQEVAERDRAAASSLAAEDRAVSRHEAERRHRLDLLLRLSENLERGGSPDSNESRRMGAEAGALISALGPDVVPELWKGRGSIEEASARLAAIPTSDWDWRHRADAVAIALYRLGQAT